jgi:hypothetical protein
MVNKNRTYLFDSAIVELGECDSQRCGDGLDAALRRGRGKEGWGEGESDAWVSGWVS